MPVRLRKAALPYLLLLPGLGWLLLFFALPLVYMAFESLKTGTIDTGFQLTWEFSNYTNALKRLQRAVHPLVRIRRARHADRAPDRLPARLRDRVPRRKVAERAAAPRDRAVLRHVPDPHALVGDDPVRLGRRREHAQDARDRLSGRAFARHHGLRGRGHHLQLPAVHDPAAVREPGADRPQAARGGLRPVRPAPRRVPARHAAALHAGRRGRRAAHLHPGGRRLHQRAAAGYAQAVHDRKRHPVALPGAG